jgi:hypothetical protein
MTNSLARVTALEVRQRRAEVRRVEYRVGSIDRIETVARARTLTGLQPTVRIGFTPRARREHLAYSSCLGLRHEVRLGEVEALQLAPCD